MARTAVSILAVLGVALLSTLGAAAQAQTYTFTELGGLEKSFSLGWGISQRGAVVGYSGVDGGSNWRATLWRRGQAVGLGPADVTSQAFAVNKHGDAVGESTPIGAAEWHATLWRDGLATDLGTLGGPFGTATAINGLGQIAGYAQDARGRYHAALWEGDTAVDLGALAGDHGYAWGINDAGTIVGHSYLTRKPTPSDSRAVMWVDRTIIDMNTLLDDATRAAGWVLLDARAINAAGQVAGTAKNTLTGKTRAYLLTPP